MEGATRESSASASRRRGRAPGWVGVVKARTMARHVSQASARDAATTAATRAASGGGMPQKTASARDAWVAARAITDAGV